MSSRSRSLRVITVAVLMAALALPVQAQRRSTIELGALARYTVYDDSVGLDDAWGLRGRLGWVHAGNWAIEGDGGVTPAQTSSGGLEVTTTRVHG